MSKSKEVEAPRFEVCAPTPDGVFVNGKRVDKPEADTTPPAEPAPQEGE